MKHEHKKLCIGCVKWALILYVAHWVLHAVVFIINPAWGVIFLALF